MFSFTCDTATIQRIIEKKNLKQFSDNMNEGLHFGEDFHWWNKNKILEIKPFKSGIENEFWQFLWYDKENKKAYYQEFSL